MSLQIVAPLQETDKKLGSRDRKSASTEDYLFVPCKCRQRLTRSISLANILRLTRPLRFSMMKIFDEFSRALLAI
jgi:hypothetical protein